MRQPTLDTEKLAAEMNGGAAIVVRAGRAMTDVKHTKTPISKDAAALALVIGALSYIRVEGLNEEAIIKQAQRAVPTSLFQKQ